MGKDLRIDFTIAFSSLLIFLISCQLLSAGFTTVFPHLYYLPILVAAYYYPRRGPWIAAVLCISYIIPVLYFYPGDPVIIASALIRAFMFVLVAAIVSGLVISKDREQAKNLKLLDFQNRIIENPNVLVVVSEMNGNVIIWNRAAEGITGYSKAEVTGRNDIWKKIFPGAEEKDEITALFPKIIDKPEVLETISIPLITKEGKKKYLLGSLQGLSAGACKKPEILAIAVDITKEKELEMEKEEALAQIEKNVSQMYALNDEIRNPLTVILGLAELNNYSSKEMIAEQVKSINEIITELDRDSLESTKILEYLRKHYGFFR